MIECPSVISTRFPLEMKRGRQIFQENVYDFPVQNHCQLLLPLSRLLLMCRRAMFVNFVFLSQSAGYVAESKYVLI